MMRDTLEILKGGNLAKSIVGFGLSIAQSVSLPVPWRGYDQRPAIDGQEGRLAKRVLRRADEVQSAYSHLRYDYTTYMRT